EDKLVSKQFFTEYQKQEINVNCITGDESGNLWAAGSSGIFHIRDGEIKGHFQPLKKDGSPMFITSIAVDARRKELWAGDNNAGLARISFAPEKNTFSYRMINYFGSAEGLTDTHIRSLNFDSRSNLWVGTRLGGIFRLRQKSESVFTFDQYNTSHGIPCTRVTDIAEEKDSAVWFATCDGVLRFSLSDETWNTYGVGDGLLGSEIFSLSVDSRNHHLWAVSGQGVTDLNYDKRENNRPPPPVNITQVSILGQEDPTALLLNTTKKLEADENSIGFSFAGSSYTDEKKVRYKYMLEGYDKTWSRPVQSNNVNYASLPFGFYTFKVQASNGDRWSEQPATFSFRVVRPFYRSFWFIALISCLVVASVYFIREYRLKQKLKLERLRVNIARDLHDDIGSALGSINLLSENAMRRMTSNRSVEDVSGVFQKIGHSAQSMLDSMDDIIWTINPEKDSLDDLIVRMREFAIPLLEAKNISFDINMKAAEGIKPSMEIRRNVYLIFKEAIFNIVRHSECTKVSIHAYFNSRTFELTITDNGKGFNANGPTGRNGIRNMQKRAAISGASLEIDSAPSEGTSIRFHGIIK
ncbi:MAG TPA: triple tyrosine motif-containing protein, partial [Chitinophagaceae bacterium]